MAHFIYHTTLALGLSMLLASSPIHAEEKKQTVSETSTTADMHKLSETLGNFIGKNLANSNMQFDVESLIKGIRDGAAGKPAPMTEEEYEKALTSIQEDVFTKVSEANLKAANEFLAENAKKSKVIQLEPGKLQYEVIAEGSGPVVDANSKPLINYEGRFIDGTVFNTSQDYGGAIVISLDQTIPGFSKLLQGMKEGEKRKLYIHPDLGYGTTGQLPPNSLLVFDVEVIKANSEPAEEASKDTGDELEPEAIEEIDIYEPEVSNTPKAASIKK